MTGIWDDLATPPGAEGSGLRRYGAAMALHARGLIPDAVLEVYRLCAPLDAEDPAAVLVARGLPLPASPPGDGASAIRALLDEADAYLATLPGPGVAEVRAGLAAASPALPAPVANPVIARHLPTALSALWTDAPALAAAIAGAAPHLGWITYDGYPEAEIGATFACGHAYAPIATGADYELGLFVIAPGILYRDHCHPAPELYAPLTGPHLWRFGVGAPLVEKPAHAPVWNEPLAPHLTKVGRVPFLCLYGWTRDVRLPARVIPAPDWDSIEAMSS